jgi:uncharacterized Fe-S cluster-containing MiaB family protein
MLITIIIVSYWLIRGRSSSHNKFYHPTPFTPRIELCHKIETKLNFSRKESNLSEISQMKTFRVYITLGTTSNYLYRNYLNKNYQNRNYLNKNYQNRNYLNKNYQNRNYLNKNYQTKNYQIKNYQIKNYQILTRKIYLLLKKHNFS